MEPRSSARQPRRNSGLRDYRTLTLPTVSRPSRLPVEDQRGWDAQEGNPSGSRGRERIPESQPTRALIRAASRAPRPERTENGPDERELSLPAKVRRRPTSIALPATGGVLVMGSGSSDDAPLTRIGRAAGVRRRVPVRVLGMLAMVLAAGLAVAAPRVSAIAADSTCSWYTVKPGDTLRDIGTAHHATAQAVAQANHISAFASLYVGQRLCIPTTWWSQAQLAPAIPSSADLALPAGVLAGEPCTEDRAIVWTVPVSQWAVPPGCFGKVFYPNPLSYMVNGQVIGGFGWCNWWPEALLRDPNALSLPEHKEVRVGWPVFYKPQPGDHIGHYAFVESIGPDGWILISEMNMNWRGAGWARVNYRYIRVDYPGATYLYPDS